jgi:nitrogen PTS system EIIA component
MSGPDFSTATLDQSSEGSHIGGRHKRGRASPGEGSKHGKTEHHGTPPRGDVATGFTGTQIDQKMTLTDIIDARAILPDLKVQNKKQLLQEIAQALATRVAIDSRIIFETLLQREKLGSTGLGQGLAIPHGRLPSITRVYGLFARLHHAVPFESVDEEPVDLVFALISPDHAGADHLTALARVSRLLRDASTLKKLRGTESPEGLYAILTQPVVNTATAA